MRMERGEKNKGRVDEREKGEGEERIGRRGKQRKTEDMKRDENGGCFTL